MGAINYVLRRVRIEWERDPMSCIGAAGMMIVLSVLLVSR